MEQTKVKQIELLENIIKDASTLLEEAKAKEFSEKWEKVGVDFEGHTLLRRK